MVRSPLRRKKRLNPVSKKRIKINKEYSRLRAEFLAAHPFDQVAVIEAGADEAKVIENNGWLFKDGQTMYFPVSKEIHHRKHRGRYLLDTSTWYAVSPSTHRWIHDHPKEAMEMGYLLPR